MLVSLAQYREEIGLFYNHSFAPDLCYMFSITNFMFLLVKNLQKLLLGLALFKNQSGFKCGDSCIN